jgi:hypothetical protein
MRGLPPFSVQWFSKPRFTSVSTITQSDPNSFLPDLKWIGSDLIALI